MLRGCGRSKIPSLFIPVSRAPSRSSTTASAATSSGPDPEGYLCYHPAGIVSATLGDSARPPVPAGDPQSGTDDDYEKMARRFIAYAGPFSADAGNGTVTHHVDVSLFPNWQGCDQVRRVTIEGGRLSIIASDRTSADGRTFHSELIWLRV